MITIIKNYFLRISRESKNSYKICFPEINVSGRPEWVANNNFSKPKNQDIRCVILIQPDEDEYPNSIYPANELYFWNGCAWYAANGKYYDEIKDLETGEKKYVDLGIDDKIVVAYIPLYPYPED